MNWHRLHHLYIGVGGGILCGVVGVVFACRHSLTGTGLSALAGLLSFLWAIDDWIYHQFGKKTPCWHIEQWLLGFEWWRKLRDWLNKLFGGKDNGNTDK